MSGVEVDLETFPSLELLCWRDSWDVWHPWENPLGVCIARLQFSDVESFLPPLTGAEDASIVERWMKAITEVGAEVIASLPDDDGAERYDEYEGVNMAAHGMLFKVLSSKNRPYRFTSKVDTNFILKSTDPETEGQTISLVLVCSLTFSPPMIHSYH